MLGQQVIEILVINAISILLGVAAVFNVFIKVFANGIKILYKKQRTAPPSLISDQNFGTHQYLHLKERGVKLHYVEKGDKSSPLLLCLHGFPECWFSWRHQLREFSSQLRVVAVDLRGYGESDKPKRVSDYSSKEIVEDIRSFIQGLEPVDGKCSVMGHDWGGIIAWKLVESYPHLFSRHISINAPHSAVMSQVFRSSLTQMKMSWYILLFRLPFLPEWILQLNDFELLQKTFRGSRSLEECFTEDILDVYKYYWFNGGLKYPINYYKMSFKTDLNSKEPSEKIDVPTLIIWGKQDSALSDEIPKRMTRLCSDIQLKQIQTAGHFVHEEDPVVVNELIWNYIRITQMKKNLEEN